MVFALVVVAVLLAAGWVAWRRFRPRPLFKLTLREGTQAGVEFLIRTPVATIGSAEGQSVVVSHPKVSQRHVVLELTNGTVRLRDHSRYGTRVNGEIAQEAELHSGDLIRLGDSVDLIFTRL